MGSKCSVRLVIADSGSTDLTHDILIKLKEEYPQLVILSDTGKGHESNLIAFYDYAIRQAVDYIFQTDSDGQTVPAEFSLFWQEKEHWEAILGHRAVRGDGKGRAFVEKVVCFLLYIYFGVRVPDANAPFRLMKTSSVKKYLYKLPSDYNIPNIMMTVYFVYFKERTIFKTITFKPRQDGINSVNFQKIIRIGWKVLQNFGRFKHALKTE